MSEPVRRIMDDEEIKKERFLDIIDFDEEFLLENCLTILKKKGTSQTLTKYPKIILNNNVIPNELIKGNLYYFDWKPYLSFSKVSPEFAYFDFPKEPADSDFWKCCIAKYLGKTAEQGFIFIIIFVNFCEMNKDMSAVDPKCMKTGKNWKLITDIPDFYSKKDNYFIFVRKYDNKTFYSATDFFNNEIDKLRLLENTKQDVEEELIKNEKKISGHKKNVTFSLESNKVYNYGGKFTKKLRKPNKKGKMKHKKSKKRHNKTYKKK